MSDSENRLSLNAIRPLQITIGTYPSPSLSLDQDIKLIKAAILYGDRVELYSLTASIIAMTTKLRKVPIDIQIHMLETVMPYIKNQEESTSILETV